MAVNATAVWRVRPSGSNTNGGGYDPGISGAGTDYSQQNAAQASGTNGATTGTTTFTDATANAFTSAMVGNAMYITGTGQTTGWYFVTGFTSASIVTLDRSPGTGTGATWNLGGGWADFWTNLGSSGPIVNGNFIYVLGSGIPNPASYTYDYTVTSAQTFTSSIVNQFTIANDPNTPGYKAFPDTTGGMPTVRINFSTGSSAAAFSDNANNGYGFEGIWFVGSTANSAGDNFFRTPWKLLGCVVDQFGKDTTAIWNNGNDNCSLIGSEIFSSVAASGGSSAAVLTTSGTSSLRIIGCNIHDCVGYGINQTGGSFIILIHQTIIAKNGADGIRCIGATQLGIVLLNNTIDGNAGNGITITTLSAFDLVTMLSNIVTNHSQAGKYGLDVSFSSSTANALATLLVDYNVYYNNTSDINNLNYGPHDTHGGSNPYVGQSTENYALA